MKRTLIVGLSNDATYSVTKDMSAPHLRRVVLSTPSMIGMIEGTCLMAVRTHLDDGETTVGTHVCVSHDAAVGEGEQFVIRCRLESIDRRRLTFRVEVDGPRGLVSRGTHQRAVVSLDRMGGQITARERVRAITDGFRADVVIEAAVAFGIWESLMT